jgi:hypothetical protein
MTLFIGKKYLQGFLNLNWTELTLYNFHNDLLKEYCHINYRICDKLLGKERVYSIISISYKISLIIYLVSP